MGAQLHICSVSQAGRGQASSWSGREEGRGWGRTHAGAEGWGRYNLGPGLTPSSDCHSQISRARPSVHVRCPLPTHSAAPCSLAALPEMPGRLGRGGTGGGGLPATWKMRFQRSPSIASHRHRPLKAGLHTLCIPTTTPSSHLPLGPPPGGPAAPPVSPSFRVEGGRVLLTSPFSCQGETGRSCLQESSLEARSPRPPSSALPDRAPTGSGLAVPCSHSLTSWVSEKWGTQYRPRQCHFSCLPSTPSLSEIPPLSPVA